jgi:hypothetical protein
MLHRQTWYHRAIRIIFKIINFKPCSIFVYFLAKIKNSPFCFLKGPGSLTVILLYAVVQQNCSTFGKIEPGPLLPLQNCCGKKIVGLIPECIFNYLRLCFSGCKND